jgi:DNA polymerase elongation subunit (family B)
MSINNNSIEFQLYDWLEDHYIINNEDDDEEDERIGKFIIHGFGRTECGKSVYAKILNYTPYFYILIPDKLQNKSKSELEIIIKKMERYFKGYENKKVWYKLKSTLLEMYLVKLKRPEGFTNDKEFYFARLVFSNSDGLNAYKRYFENNDIKVDSIPELAHPYKFKLYEANFPPMLRCFHIRDISGCSWIQTSFYELIEEDKESYCDIEIHVDWTKLNPIKKENNAPFRICSFDIECNSIDGEFPQAKRAGDAVIQIGATYTILGQATPYRQYIVCLKDTSPIENIIVESCDTEHELMLKFLEEINSNDCDIITGYNIFFFDEKYMFDRCKDILGLEKQMSYMSKLKNYESKFKEMKLASSALGENLIRFWNTPGRIHIDLMKDVQKTFSLPSYKLDSVASKFIRGEVSSYNQIDKIKFELVCKSVQDILVGDYIHLEVIKGFISDEVGDKYLVLDVDTDNKKIIVKGNDTLASELDESKLEGIINWSQAKDDVSPKDIFRLQKGTPDDRAIVAKYCIKDCKLVSLLINKLEVITKNIEMANVCYVPLSYLFIRGQGIKLFSLCLKEFRKQKYAFPVIKLNKEYKCSDCESLYFNVWSCPKCGCKKREEIECETSKYEGAIVFDPVPKVEYEALVTKDYMSLYPASIMHKNMSHETMVEDPQYDNLTGVTYYNAYFKDPTDNSDNYRRFAKVNNKLGVIPTILDNLLVERKAIKKQMAKEKDQFKYRILDAKQLAVKVTANSLYGQLGAATSPVCKRDIAACTTSTGREMLYLAKKYDEEFLPWIINGIKYFYQTNQEEKIKMIYNEEEKLKTNNFKYDDKLIESVATYVAGIKDLTFQPIIRYGDTDSIFSCYRFRENTTKVNKLDSLNLWKKIVRFARVLIEPFFNTFDRELFIEIFETYYSDDKITKMQLPPAPECVPEPPTNKIVLEIEERIKQFIKEYIEESYIPWLWTLVELVEKEHENMFDIKLIQWANHQLNKVRITAEDMDENRKNYLLVPLHDYIEKIFSNKYFKPSDEIIHLFVKKLNKDNVDCFPFAHEIKIDMKKLFTLSKNLLERTIKEKWIMSADKKELTTIINQYLEQVCVKSDEPITNPEKIYCYLIEFVNCNQSLGSSALATLLNKNLIDDLDMGYKFIKDKLDIHTIEFVDKLIKARGKKDLKEICCDFLEKDLELSFNLDKQNHFDKVINFIKTTMREEDMSQMDSIKYNYYWIQPRWDFDSTSRKIYKIDIYYGGDAITDKRSLEYGMELGKLSGELIKSRLPWPHDCEYEKTFWPFAILTKKRYVGNKYEFDTKKFKQDFMGIVLKRRDNAAIVKEICSGIIDYLINKRDPNGAKIWTRLCLQKMFDGEYDIKYFLQSRNLKLKESYKDWRKIAHIYLAEQIRERDPGNAPQSGDRIEFAVVKDTKRHAKADGIKLLQGDFIETPQFIKEANLEIDYLFYLTNQIMNPALQFLELVDKNAINIFKEFINKYSMPKPIKEPKVKPIKEPKVKPIKEPKVKPIKEPKVKPIKEPKIKPIKEPKIKLVKKVAINEYTNDDEVDKPKKTALDLLLEIKTNKTIKTKLSHSNKLCLNIKKFIDEINEHMANTNYDNNYDNIFLDNSKHHHIII